jgi:hypothetical protein
MIDEPEEWRPVVGWEGLYEVSSLGRVRSRDRTELVTCGGRQHFRRRRGKTLKAGPAGREGQYLQVVLHSDANGRKNKAVHHLVLEAFVSPRPAAAEASHINGRSDDNRAANLVWEKHRENMARQWYHGTICVGETNGNHRLTAEQVARIRLLKGVEDSRTVAARFGCGATTVKGIWRGERRQYD